MPVDSHQSKTHHKFSTVLVTHPSNYVTSTFPPALTSDTSPSFSFPDTLLLRHFVKAVLVKHYYLEIIFIITSSAVKVICMLGWEEGLMGLWRF